MNRNKKARLDIKDRIQEQKISEEQRAYDRKIKKERNKIMTTNINREIEYKLLQLDNGITETRTINRIPDGTAVVVDGYVDNLKPKFMIQNEIDTLGQRVKEFNEEVKAIEELENANTEPERETRTE